jgi:drug/metabolite transporter (DMT)-like permease
MKQRAHLALVGTTLIFGMHYSIAKGLMPASFTPAQLIFFRLLGGVIIFWIFQRLFVPEKVNRRDLGLLALCGILGFALNQALFYEGLNLTNPVDASLIHVMNPILVLVFAHLIIHERITWIKSGGIALGVAGSLILILTRGGGRFEGNLTLGNILVLFNMVFYALYLVIIKPLTARYHTTTILKWVSFFGFISIAPFTIRDTLAYDVTSMTLDAFLGLAYVILLNTFIAYLLINFALKQLSPGVVSYYNYLQPVIATIMSVSTGQAMLTWQNIAAALLIFSGVFLVNYRREEVVPVQKK